MARLTVRLNDLRESTAKLRAAYLVTLAVSMKGSNLASTVSIPVVVECVPTIAIMSGSEQMHAKARQMTLVSVLTDEFVSTDSTTYAWSCNTAAGDGCVDSDSEPLTFPSSSDLTVPAGSLDLGEYFFNVCANEAIDRKACATVQVTMVSDCLPIEMMVSARGFPAERVAAHVALSFTGNIVGVVDQSDVVFVWSLGDVVANINGPNAYMPNSIAAPVLQSGSFAKFTLEAFQYDDSLRRNVSGKATTIIEMPPVPSGGSVTLVEGVNGSTSQIETYGWGGGGANVLYECFYVIGVVGKDHDQDTRVYLTLGPTASPVFAVDYLPTGNVTVGVVASNAFGSNTAITLIEIAANPNLGAELAGKKQAVLNDAARSGNVMPPVQLFNVFASSLDATVLRDRRDQPFRIAAARRRSTADNQGMMVDSMHFNLHNMAAVGFAAALQTQYTTVKTVKDTFSSILAATRDAAYTTSIGILTELLDNPLAPPMSTSLAQRSIDLLVLLEHVTLVAVVPDALVDEGEAGDGVDENATVAASLLRVMLAVTSRLFDGPDAPTAPGAMIALSNPKSHDELSATVALAHTGTVAGIFISANQPLPFGMLVMAKSSPVAAALGVPTNFESAVLVHASSVIAVQSFVAAGEVRFELPVTPSAAARRSIVCAVHSEAEGWKADGTRVVQSDLTFESVTCVLPANSTFNAPVILGVFEDTSITTPAAAAIASTEPNDGNSALGDGSEDGTPVPAAYAAGNPADEAHAGGSGSGSGSSSGSGAGVGQANTPWWEGIQLWMIVVGALVSAAVVSGLGYVFKHKHHHKVRHQRQSEWHGDSEKAVGRLIKDFEKRGPHLLVRAACCAGACDWIARLLARSQHTCDPNPSSLGIDVLIVAFVYAAIRTHGTTNDLLGHTDHELCPLNELKAP
jgi:hypothetical protein